MSCIKFDGLIVLVMICMATCESCLISKVPYCTDYNLLAGVQLHAFISADILDVYCRRLQAALACAYASGRLNRCPLIYRLPFDTQQGVVEVVCQYRREEYLKSSQCLSKHEVKHHITSTCLPVLASGKMVSADRCSTLAWILECARTKVLMTDGCDSADSELMVDLVQRFIQPNSKQPNSKQPNCTTLGSNVGSQGKLTQLTSSGTTQKYLDDATLPSQSASHTSNVVRHKDEQTRPEIGLSQNQNLTQQPQEAMTLPSTSSDLLLQDGMEPESMKSTINHFTESMSTSREHITSPVRSSTSAVNLAQSLDNTEVWSMKPSPARLESPHMKYEQKNGSRSMSQANMTLQAKALKSTQSSGNDATIVGSTRSRLTVALSSVVSLVLCVQYNYL